MIFLASIRLAFIFITSVAADYANATLPRSTVTLAPTYTLQPLTSVSTYNDLTTTINITNTFYSTIWYAPITSVFFPSITTETLERTTIYETTRQDTIYTVTSTIFSTKQITFIQPTKTGASSIRHSNSKVVAIIFPSPGVKAAAEGHFSTIYPTGTISENSDSSPTSASSSPTENDEACILSTKIVTVSAPLSKAYVTVTVTAGASGSPRAFTLSSNRVSALSLESVAPSRHTTTQSPTLKSSSDIALSLSSNAGLSHGSTDGQPFVASPPSDTSPTQPLRSIISSQSPSPSSMVSILSSTLSSTLEASRAPQGTEPFSGTPSEILTDRFPRGSTAQPSTISAFESEVPSPLSSGSVTSYQSISTQASITSILSPLSSPTPYSGSSVPSTASQPSMPFSLDTSLSSSLESTGLAASQSPSVAPPSSVSSPLSLRPSLSHFISTRSSISPSLSSSGSTLPNPSPQSLAKYPFLANGTSSFIG